MSLLSDLQIATSALRANQYAISVTGHNVANADTEGYRRQDVVFATDPPTYFGKLELGNGVHVEAIKRAQTAYVDRQLRSINQQNGYWEAKSQSMNQLESYLNEPSDTGISAMLGNFWNSWNALSASPESVTARSTVVDAGTALADKIRTLYQNMKSVQEETDNQIVEKANDVNDLASQIAALNKEIATAGVDEANDLLDAQDLLIDKLSKLINIDVHGTAGNGMIISAGGMSLVQGEQSSKLEIINTELGKSAIMWANSTSELKSPGGQLGGLVSLRDDVIQADIDSLNNITKSIVERVNAEHSKGVGVNGRSGGFFAENSDASTISVQSDLIATPAGVAASGTGALGDNSVAIAVSNIKAERFINNQTIGDVYSAFVSAIAGQANQANSMSNTLNLAAKQLNAQKDSVAGVSLDEELSNMIKFQQSYNAAARVFSVIDEMLDVTINRMGAGR